MLAGLLPSFLDDGVNCDDLLCRGERGSSRGAGGGCDLEVRKSALWRSWVDVRRPGPVREKSPRGRRQLRVLCPGDFSFLTIVCVHFFPVSEFSYSVTEL